jgi:hypothetical protein
MNILIVALIVLAAIIVFILTVAIFLKKDYTVERTIAINKSNIVVFNYIKFVKNQAYYNKWTMTDPNAKMEYRGTDGGVGFVSAWDSQNKQVGKGEQEIMKITEGARIDLKMHFIKPFEGTSGAYMLTDSVSLNQTLVKWGFVSKMKYPMNLMLLFMNLPDMLGKDMDVSLANLKSLLEK